MKQTTHLFIAVVSLTVARADDAWESTRLLSEFRAEGASVGDINGDGNVDIAYGPFWFAGPKFEEKNRFAEGDAFVAEKGYSDNFFSYVVDATRDGKNDILVYGFPGKEARLYVNPGEPKDGELWQMHIVAEEISNESPTFADLIPGGLPEIVATHNTSYGYYSAGEDATKPWKWHAISPEKEAGGRFEHGMGVGDINGDGRLDIVQRMYWYEQPENAESGNWKKHGWAPLASAGGAQILVHDFDGDGDSDIVSSLMAHGYGLVWYEQLEPGKFGRHNLMGESSTDNPYGVCFSQIHALTLSDIDGDGRMDFVTGKRYLAHQGKDPGGLQEPVLYWFRNVKTDDGIDFVPHLVHRDSGVGVEITAADLNADGKPDIISGNKKGLTIHVQKGDVESTAAELWKVPGGRPQDGYGSGMAAKEALARMEVPEGFSVDLIAAEPDVTQPIAMCFDARGRIWVVEGHTYPQRAPEGDGKDRVVIFEDTDADGSFETRKVFTEGINLASGIEVGFGGVWIGAAPYLLFYPDKDADDKPDGEPEVLLDGWAYQDTHETLNSFTWGPDGWLYGCHGVFTHSNVGKPGTSDEERTKINAGIWRYHPVDHKFEVFAHGTSNPWGVDFNEYGDWFASACVIPHFYHLSQGGRYQRQAGQHFNPFTYDDIKTIADHAHYAGDIRDHAFWGANKADRPPAPTDTSALGGGHAHCGLAFYLADTFPPAYRGDVFFHNLHGHRMVRERIEHNGSGYVVRHRPDFLLANNHDYVGVGVMLGPDGAIYCADWADPQTCHHRDVEIWDRSNGRIFRVRYGDAQSTAQNLPELGNAELVNVLGGSNAVLARQAQRLLQERATAGTLDAATIEAALDDFEKAAGNDTALRLRGLWTRYVCGIASADYLNRCLTDEDEYIRGWAVSLLGNGESLSTLEEMAANEFSLFVRRRLASKLQQLPLDQRWKIAEGLISHHRSIHDPNLPYLCWYGIEPLVEADAMRALALGNKTGWPMLKDFLNRRAAGSPEGRDAIMKSLSRANNPDVFLQYSRQLLTALSNLPPVDRPVAWEGAKKKGESFQQKKAEVGDVLARLGARFGDADYFLKWREVAKNDKSPPAQRSEAVELLTVGNDPELGSIARGLLDHPGLRQAALNALRKHPSEDTAKAIVSRLSKFPLKLRNESVNLLATRPDMALVLLQAVDRGEIESSTISPVLLDQFERFKNEEIDALISNNWVRGGEGVDLAQLHKAVEDWKKKLNPKVMAKADASRGRQTFTMTCGTCHKMFGEGVALGPDLTGSNRADIGYLLENVLSPSAVVGKDYLLNIFTLKDGSTVSGMVKAESPEFVTVAMPGGSQTDVKKADITKREEVPQSLMPVGLFDALPIDQVANLVKYLGSANQVPLPGQGPPAPTSQVPPPANGTIRIEGEALVAKFPPKHGSTVVQGMSHFGPGWSGNQHLWWRGGKPGDVLTLKLEGLKPGTKNLTIYPTTAKDYATIKIAVNGQLREADLYTEAVLPGAPIHFDKVNVSPSEPLQIDIHITGKNDAALDRYMVGIDRIEVE